MKVAATIPMNRELKLTGRWFLVHTHPVAATIPMNRELKRDGAFGKGGAIMRCSHNPNE